MSEAEASGSEPVCARGLDVVERSPINVGPDGVYDRVPVPEGTKVVRSQFLFEDLAGKQYQDTVLKGRIPD